MKNHANHATFPQIMKNCEIMLMETHAFVSSADIIFQCLELQAHSTLHPLRKKTFMTSFLLMLPPPNLLTAVDQQICKLVASVWPIIMVNEASTKIQAQQKQGCLIINCCNQQEAAYFFQDGFLQPIAFVSNTCSYSASTFISLSFMQNHSSSHHITTSDCKQKLESDTNSIKIKIKLVR